MADREEIIRKFREMDFRELFDLLVSLDSELTERTDEEWNQLVQGLAEDMPRLSEKASQMMKLAEQPENIGLLAPLGEGATPANRAAIVTTLYEQAGGKLGERVDWGTSNKEAADRMDFVARRVFGCDGLTLWRRFHDGEFDPLTESSETKAAMVRALLDYQENGE